MDGTLSGKLQLGRARVVIRAIGGVREDAVVVQLLDAAPSRAGCILTRFACKRMKWRIDEATGHSAPAVVPLVRIKRLEHVVPDFKHIVERFGLQITPATIPDVPD